MQQKLLTLNLHKNMDDGCIAPFADIASGSDGRKATQPVQRIGKHPRPASRNSSACRLIAFWKQNSMTRRALASAAINAALLLSGCSESEAKRQEADTSARPVLVETVALERQVVSRSFTATIRARTESSLGFRIPGKVVSRLVENGQAVHKGDPLATLDDTDPLLQLRQAEAELRAADSSRRQAEADLQRNLDLFQRGVTAQAAVDRVRAQADEARSRTDRAHQAVDLARNNQAYATLRADADGVVTLVAVEPGTVVAAGQVAFRIARSAELEAEAAIPEAMLGKARQGRASAVLWSDPGQEIAAVLRELSPTADPATRTYTARFSLPGSPASAALGMSATVTLSEAQPEKLIRVPLSALRNTGSGTTVWVVDENAARVASREVEVARIDGSDAFIRKGLNAGDKVVRVGVHKLDPALPVRVVATFNY